MGPYSNMDGVLVRRGRDTGEAHAQRKGHVRVQESADRWPSADQGERLQGKRKCHHLHFGSPVSKTVRGKNVFYLSHTVYGILLL